MARIYLDYDPTNVWHVTPTNDIEKHSEEVSKPCKCNPRIEIQENKALLVTHNSFDRREYFEKDRRKKLYE